MTDRDLMYYIVVGDVQRLMTNFDFDFVLIIHVRGTQYLNNFNTYSNT